MDRVGRSGELESPNANNPPKDVTEKIQHSTISAPLVLEWTVDEDRDLGMKELKSHETIQQDESFSDDAGNTVLQPMPKEKNTGPPESAPQTAASHFDKASSSSCADLALRPDMPDKAKPSFPKSDVGYNAPLHPEKQGPESDSVNPKLDDGNSEPATSTPIDESNQLALGSHQSGPKIADPTLDVTARDLVKLAPTTEFECGGGSRETANQDPASEDPAKGFPTVLEHGMPESPAKTPDPADYNQEFAPPESILQDTMSPPTSADQDSADSVEFTTTTGEQEENPPSTASASQRTQLLSDVVGYANTPENTFGLDEGPTGPLAEPTNTEESTSIALELQATSPAVDPVDHQPMELEPEVGPEESSKVGASLIDNRNTVPTDQSTELGSEPARSRDLENPTIPSTTTNPSNQFAVDSTAPIPMEEQVAITKIQALQRGRHARKQQLEKTHALTPTCNVAQYRTVVEKVASFEAAYDPMCVAVSPDGAYCVAGFTDGHTRAYRIPTEGSYPPSKSKVRIMGYPKSSLSMPVNSVAWRPLCAAGLGTSVHIVLIADGEGQIQEWDLSDDSSGSPTHLNTIDNGAVNTQCLEYSPNGASFVAGNSDASIHVYDTESKQIKMLATGGQDSLGVKDFQGLFMSESHGNRVVSARFDPVRPDTFVTGSWDNTARLWDVRSGRCTTILPGLAIRGDSVDIYDGVVVTGSWRPHNQLQLWDLRAARSPIPSPVLWEASGDSHQCMLYSAKFGQCREKVNGISVSQQYVIAGGSSSDEARIFCVDNDQVSEVFRSKQHGPVVSASASGSFCAIADQSGVVEVISLSVSLNGKDV